MDATDKAVMKRGRPPKEFISPVMEEIVNRVANGETLRAICQETRMPSPSTFRSWVLKNPVLSRMWLEAKELRAHSYFDKAVDLADELDKGDKLTANQINAKRVAIDTYKFAAARLNPRDYGERVPVNPVVPIQIITSLNLGNLGPAEKNQEDDIWNLKAQPVKVIDLIPEQSDE